jgi:hypothetical protein
VLASLTFLVLSTTATLPAPKRALTFSAIEGVLTVEAFALSAKGEKLAAKSVWNEKTPLPNRLSKASAVRAWMAPDSRNVLIWFNQPNEVAIYDTLAKQLRVSFEDFEIRRHAFVRPGKLFLSGVEQGKATTLLVDVNTGQHAPLAHDFRLVFQDPVSNALAAFPEDATGTKRFSWYSPTGKAHAEVKAGKDAKDLAIELAKRDALPAKISFLEDGTVFIFHDKVVDVVDRKYVFRSSLMSNNREYAALFDYSGDGSWLEPVETGSGEFVAFEGSSNALVGQDLPWTSATVYLWDTRFGKVHPLELPSLFNTKPHALAWK